MQKQIRLYSFLSLVVYFIIVKIIHVYLIGPQSKHVKIMQILWLSLVQVAGDFKAFQQQAKNENHSHPRWDVAEVESVDMGINFGCEFVTLLNNCKMMQTIEQPL